MVIGYLGGGLGVNGARHVVYCPLVMKTIHYYSFLQIPQEKDLSCRSPRRLSEDLLLEFIYDVFLRPGFPTQFPARIPIS